jgi:transposase
LSGWSLAPVVEALQALRGVDLVVAASFVVEIGDIRRFENPRKLMGYLGLVPGERSTGDTVRRGSITKMGNPRIRQLLVESAWTYRFPARVGVAKLNCGSSCRLPLTSHGISSPGRSCVSSERTL